MKEIFKEYLQRESDPGVAGNAGGFC